MPMTQCGAWIPHSVLIQGGNSRSEPINGTVFMDPKSASSIPKTRIEETDFDRWLGPFKNTTVAVCPNGDVK